MLKRVSKRVSTRIIEIQEDDKLLTGEENFEIIGELKDDEEAKTIISESIKKCAGLKFSWNALEKAKIVNEVSGWTVVLGELMIFSEGMTSAYGYYFNPPYEFHAWNVNKRTGKIIDISLPGVIYKGLDTVNYGIISSLISGKNQTEDDRPYLIDRSLVILAGTPPDWTKYFQVHKLVI